MHERLWRDVHRSVVVTFGNLFRTLEMEGPFDNSNEADILSALHLCTQNKSGPIIICGKLK